MILPPMTKITVQTDYFDSISITRLELDGQSAWLARDIGRALGYARGGERLSRNIARRWTKDFVEGVDYDRLTGSVLERLRGLVPRLHRTRRVMVLFPSGLAKVLARSPLDIAHPLKTWLDDRLPAPEAPAAAQRVPDPRAKELLILLEAIADSARQTITQLGLLDGEAPSRH